MVKVVIPVSNKEYDIIDTMTRKEVREAARVMVPFIGFQEKLVNSKPEDINQILAELDKKGESTDVFLFKIFMRCVAGMTKEYFEEEIRNVEALLLFDAIWKASTEIPLESKKPSAS